MPRLRPVYAAVPLLISALLAGCGGGGGGGAGTGGGSTGGGTTTPVVSPALTFTPATASGSVNAGVALTLNVIGAVARPGDFTGASVFASVVDSNNVLSSSQVVQDNGSQYHVVLQTAPTLAAGNYKGNFSVRLCRDSACASQFPGAPVTLPYDITVLAAGNLPFTVVPAMPLTATAQSGVSAAATAVVVTTGGRAWTASNGGASWLKLSSTSGAGDGSLSVSYDVTGLAAGNYSGTLTFTTSDNNSLSLPVALTVLPPGLILGNNSVTFNAINGAPIASQIVSLDTESKLSTAWTASSNVGWLKVSPTAGSTPATTILTVDSTVGTLASGAYSGNITVTPTGLTTRTLPVTLNLTPATLLASAATVTLGGTYGRDFSSSQSLGLNLNTSTNSWPWQLSDVPSWVSPSATSGTVNAAGASLTLKPLVANALTSVSSKLATFSAKVNGDTVTAPVLFTINKDVHKLLPAETAVAFVSTPGWSRLTRTITVNDNFGSAGFGGMSATSDAAWLVVGVSGNQLILTADPSQLLDDSVNTASITITPTDTDVLANEPVRVAVWKGSTSPTVGAGIQATLPYTNVVTDPARPYAYVHNGGAYIDVYNVYTGLKEASITGFSAHLGDMAVTPNGDALYVVDIDNARITTVSLSTRTISAQLPLSTAGTAATRIKLVRPNGIGLLLLSDGQVYLTANNARLSNLPLTSGGTLAVSADGKRVVQQDEGGGGVQHTSVSLDYAALNGGTLFAAKLAAASHTSPGTAGQDVWVNSDGSRMIYAAATPKSCTMTDGTSLGILSYLPIGDAAPNNIDVAIDGRIFCGGAAKTGNSDIYMFSSTGGLLGQYKLSTTGKQLLPRQMAVSGDGWIVVAITEDSTVTFLAIGP